MALAGRHDGEAGEEPVDHKAAYHWRAGLNGRTSNAAGRDHCLSARQLIVRSYQPVRYSPLLRWTWDCSDLRQFVDMYQELRALDTDTAKLTASCCGTCRGLVLRASASLEADLVPCVRGLEQVEKHAFDGHDVGPSQDHGISPRKQATSSGKRVEPRLHTIPDSSDSSEID
jgi:hypothetical protein